MVYNGGADFDVTAGNVATLAASLTGASGEGFYGQNSTGIINVPAGSGGSGFIGAPLVSVSGGGQGATAIANVSNGTITGIVLTNPGQNYQPGNTLTFTFSGGGPLTSSSFQYTLQPADVQSVSGGGLTKSNAGMLLMNVSNSYTGPTVVSNGILIVGVASALPATTDLRIGSASTSAETVLAMNQSGSPLTAVQINSLTLSGNSNAWTGMLDLTNGVVDLHTGDAGTITNQLKQGYANGTWQGSGGIISSVASADPTHLTAVGLLVNNDGTGNTIYSSSTQLDGTSPQLNDILLKYTYYGDADLNGVVNSSDYTRIDTGFLMTLTGWGNGDFNYDGVVNGSDYTLIDNAFNMQGASLQAEVASPTAAIAGGATAVPEPASLGMLAMASIGILGRRSSSRRNRR